jgi:Predicted Zn peptidase
MLNARAIGTRVRRLRLVSGLSQLQLAELTGVASGTISTLENGRTEATPELIANVAAVLGCSTKYLTERPDEPISTRPWLRAYADAPKRSVDQQLADCELMTDTAALLRLKILPDLLPEFDGHAVDDDSIECVAQDVRTAAGLDEGDVVGNSVRAAERLGCIVLPMHEELGRHVGMSTRVDQIPIICVSRPSMDPERHVPGDRQRFTVAHELGHLVLHGATPPPQTSAEAAAIERQAHRFAGAFLAPADAMQEELMQLGGRVTLKTLCSIKERWGIAVKALVVRFHTMGMISDGQARSLYKQISARGWNKSEPVAVGNESALWLDKALARWSGSDSVDLDAVAASSGIGARHFKRWLDWTPTPFADVSPLETGLEPAGPRASIAQATSATVIDLASRRRG